MVPGDDLRIQYGLDGLPLTMAQSLCPTSYHWREHEHRHKQAERHPIREGAAVHGSPPRSREKGEYHESPSQTELRSGKSEVIPPCCGCRVRFQSVEVIPEAS